MADLELDEQVREVAALMLENRWVAGSSHLEMSEKWGVTINQVQRRASEASRFIRLCHGNEDDIRDALFRNIDRIGGKAEGAGDYRNALGAQELACKVHGLLEQKRREESTDVPITELAELLRAHGYDVKGPDGPTDERKPAAPDHDAQDEGDQASED